MLEIIKSVLAILISLCLILLMGSIQLNTISELTFNNLFTQPIILISDQHDIGLKNNGITPTIFIFPSFDSITPLLPEQVSSYEPKSNIVEKPLLNNLTISIPITKALQDTSPINSSKDTKLEVPQFDKSNMTYGQKKLSTDILELLDSKFLPSGQSRDNLINTMTGLKQYTPANTVSKNGTMNDEMVYVYIYLVPTVSTHVIDAYAWDVTDRDENNHIAVAWIELKNIDALSSLPEVNSIQTVTPPMTR